MKKLPFLMKKSVLQSKLIIKSSVTYASRLSQVYGFYIMAMCKACVFTDTFKIRVVRSKIIFCSHWNEVQMFFVSRWVSVGLKGKETWYIYC